MLRDVVDLRENQWIPRREENYNPKTIDQIHKEAQMEKMQEQRLAAQLPSKDNKKKGGGGNNTTEYKPFTER
jgi:translation initiation factor 4G